MANGHLMSRQAEKKLGRARSEETSWRQWTSLGRLPTPSSNTSQRYDGVKQYAQKFISDEGQQNGLYWPEVSGQPKSPLGPLIAFATAQGLSVQPNRHQPFYGYYFAMLEKQGPDAKGGAKNYIANGKMTGGFAVVAYPAQYRDWGS